MKKTHWGLSLLLGLSISACKDLKEVSPIGGGGDDTGTETITLPAANKGNSNATVNNWIYANMNAYYLWGDNMPSKANMNLNATPDEFFEKLLYKYGEVDRFSWIEEDAEELSQSLNGITKSSGFSYTPFLQAQNSNKVLFAVRYVIKNSPAERAGLKRGDIILKVNGADITTENYQTVLSPESLTFTLGERGASGFVSNNQTVSVVKEVIQNFPVQYATILSSGNTKVGYLVYNQFIPGTQNNSRQFDNELRSVFGTFKAQGVNELVLDLRYNGGGYISSADVLSSLIVKNLKPGTLMNKQIWSKNAKEIFNEPESSYESYWLNEPNNIGDKLNRVFVLVSNGTASASEMVINNLLPFMDVILIGDNTYGKDVGSITIDDESNKYRWKWGLQPIVLRTVNSRGEANYGTKDGFAPTYPVQDNVLPFLEFGNPNETLLSKALEVITGSNLSRARVGATTTLPVLDAIHGFDNPRNNILDMYVDKTQRQ